MKNEKIVTEQGIKPLHLINDFPHVGLIYFENSGENLLRYYLEKIFKIKTETNIKKEYLIANYEKVFPKTDQDLNLSWIVASDYPIRPEYEYENLDISFAVLLVRNPIELIISLIFKDSVLLEEATSKLEDYINKWKNFYKYWIHSPIPTYIIKYEELLENPTNILMDLSRFLLGFQNMDNTKVSFEIDNLNLDMIDTKYSPFNINVSLAGSLGNKTLMQFKEKFKVIKKLMRKFNYSSGEDEDDPMDIINEEAYGNWLNEFNNENLTKSIELQESVANSILSSNYYALKIA